MKYNSGTMSYQVQQKPLAWFRENPENYRSHPPEQIEVLRQSLQRFGVFRNVVALPDGTLLAGHGIIAAAREEGLDDFPCIVFEGTADEARALMVADNEQARLAVDDSAQLAELLRNISESDMLDVTGHNDESLAALLGQVYPDAIDIDQASAQTDMQLKHCPKCGFEWEE